MRRSQNGGTGRMDGWRSSMKPYSSNELNAIYTRIACVGLGAGLLVPLSSVNRRRVSGPTFEVSLRYSNVVGEPSDAAAVRNDGATNGGSHDPSRVEPPVVAMKKSIRGKTAKGGVCEISGSGSGDNDS